MVPVFEFGLVEAGALGQFAAARLRQVAQHLQGAGQHPGGGDVGVGVVVEAGAAGVRIGVVVLVGAHHALDAVAAEPFVEGGGATRKEICSSISAPLVCRNSSSPAASRYSHVVGDRRAHVVLGGEWSAASGPTAVEVQLLGLLPAVAAGLPQVHRAAPPGVVSRRPGAFQAPVPVVQQRPGHLQEVQVQVRQHEQLVPEHVPPVCLAVQPARRHPHVQVGGGERVCRTWKRCSRRMRPTSSGTSGSDRRHSCCQAVRWGASSSSKGRPGAPGRRRRASGR